MATKDSSQVFINFLNKISDYSYDKVIRENLGSGALIEIKTFINDVIKNGKRIEPFLEYIDDTSIQELYQLLSQFSDVFDSISNLADSNFIAQKNNSKIRVETLHSEFTRVWSRIIGLVHEYESKETTSKTENEFIEILNQTKENAAEIELIRNRLAHEIEDFEKRYTPTFQKAEIDKQSNIFNEQAERFQRNSMWWIGGVILSSIFLFVIIFQIFKNFCFELSCIENLKNLDYNKVCDDCNRMVLYLEIFKAVAFRLFVISFLVYLVNFCVKNYNSSMHNYTINRHKANSLDASIRLLERLYSENAKDEVITNAANAIFSHQPTGYSDKNPENLKSSLTEKIVEKFNPGKNLTE